MFAMEANGFNDWSFLSHSRTTDILLAFSCAYGQLRSSLMLPELFPDSIAPNFE
jgi:hypothetical protein